MQQGKLLVHRVSPDGEFCRFSERAGCPVGTVSVRTPMINVTFNMARQGAHIKWNIKLNGTFIESRLKAPTVS